ncbi:MAG: BTAD domain-containing putative transcriptional regulator, partial [Planctomycetota bacterium]
MKSTQQKRKKGVPSGLQVRLLGGFAATDGAGAALKFPTRKAEALLAVLAVAPGSGWGRDELAALLWPDSIEGSGRTNLRQSLAQLRKALSGASVAGVVSEGDQVRLDAEGVTVDAAALTALPADPTIEQLEAATAGGSELLAGFPAVSEPFEEWLRAERGRLRALAERAEDRLLDAYGDAGRREDAAALAERCLAADPARESAYRALLRGHAQAGDRAAAARCFARCREALERELGAAPSDATVQLYDSIAASAPVAVAPAHRSVAVLPFENRSDDPAQQYFADGVVEDILTDLARFRALRVVSRNTSFALRGDSRPLPEIARSLGVRYLLTGSLRRAGDRLRVAAQLIDAGADSEVWAERFDVPLGELFDVQDRIVQAVVHALAAEIEEAALREARRRPAEDLQAYECWLRGLDLLRGGTRENDAAARGWFEQAIAADPHFARGYTGMSLSYFNDWSCQAWDRWEDRAQRAFEYAQRAVALDERDPVTHVILGRILLYRREFAQAEWHLNRAVALNPNDPDTLLHAGTGMMFLGKLADALDLLLTAIRLNPHARGSYFMSTGMVLVLMERFEEASEYLQRAPDMYVDGRAWIAAALAQL